MTWNHWRFFLKPTIKYVWQGLLKNTLVGLIKGIGSKFAKRIIRQFGRDILDVIETDIQRVLKVPGIGKKRVENIHKSCEGQKEIKNVMLFLQEHGVSTSFATRIYKQYGNKSIEMVRENPFRLVDDIWGIGFKTADGIAEKLSFEKNSFIRL